MWGIPSRRWRGIILCLFVQLAVHLSCPDSAAAGDLTETPLLPLDPSVMGQGGAATALAAGYDSLLTNPASFSREKSELTIVSVSPWMYGTASRAPQLLDVIADPKGADDAAVDTMKRQTEESGFGFGGSLGLGYVGNGFGIGFISTFDAFFYGRPFPSGVTGELNTQMDLVVGLSLPIDWLGIRWRLGADVRPFIRVRAPVEGAEAEALIDGFLGTDGASTLESALRSVDALNGYGVAFDAGVIAEAGDFSLGLAFRDIPGVELAYSLNGFREVTDQLSEFRLPGEDDTALPDRYRIPMQVNLGVGYDPAGVGPISWIDPRFQLEVKDMFGTLRPDASIWTRVHAGAEVRLFSRFALRAGISQGFPTFGAGLHLLFLDLNAAVFTREFGDRVGDRSVPGFSVEAAIRL